MIESDNEWPGAFAPVRRHQEEILQINTGTPKRKASPDPDSRQSRHRAARGNSSGFYREETGFEGTGTLGAGPSSGQLELYPTTPDETIVNVHLILLIHELIDLKRSSNLQCTITGARRQVDAMKRLYDPVHERWHEILLNQQWLDMPRMEQLTGSFLGMGQNKAHHGSNPLHFIVTMKMAVPQSASHLLLEALPRLKSVHNIPKAQPYMRCFRKIYLSGQSLSYRAVRD
jgi:hypothetical protein